MRGAVLVPVGMEHVRVGCVGWHYPHWSGPVYPSGLAPARWLEAYANLFGVVEVDTTFYGLPTEMTVARWLRTVDRREGFGFATKAPREATHEAFPRGRRRTMERALRTFVDRVVVPIERCGRSEGVLLQLPPSVAATQGSLRMLAAALDDLDAGARRVAVEFRHRSWFGRDGTLLPTALDLMRGADAAVVHVDGLRQRFTPSRTAAWSYFRFHGRADEQGGTGYDYLYRSGEIVEIAQAVRASARSDRRTIAVFNNDVAAQAPRNAVDLLRELGLPAPRFDGEALRTVSLDEFALTTGA
jgi:uncharacterized protein YecE (DUF72 family)